MVDDMVCNGYEWNINGMTSGRDVTANKLDRGNHPQNGRMIRIILR